MRIAVGAVVIAAVAALGACSSSGSSTDATPIGGDVVAPVTRAADDLQGETVDLVVGQVLNITTGDLAVDSYTGEVADPDVAAFVAGREEGGAVFNPGVEAVDEGTTEVMLTNTDGGIQPLEFTVVVSAK